MPVDSMLDIQGTYYNVGRHGLAFIWLNNGWVRSAKSAANIYAAIDKERSDG